jgi:hypothetical protein
VKAGISPHSFMAYCRAEHHNNRQTSAVAENRIARPIRPGVMLWCTRQAVTTWANTPAVASHCAARLLSITNRTGRRLLVSSTRAVWLFIHDKLRCLIRLLVIIQRNSEQGLILSAVFSLHLAQIISRGHPYGRLVKRHRDAVSA